MTLQSQVSRVAYSGDGATTEFTVTFYFLADAHLKVIVTSAAGVETVQTLDTDFTVSGAGNTNGGTVDFTTAPASGTTVTIIRDPAVTQLVDYNDQDPFPAETTEQAFDKLTMIAQRLDDRLDRAPLLKESSTNSGLTLPEPEAGKLLRWNGSATDLENATVVDSGETFPTAASRYIRRNDAGTAFDALTAQESSNLDELKAVNPGATGLALLADATVAEAKATLEIGEEHGIVKVAFATTTNIDLAGGGLANGTTHDGHTAATGELALVAGQTAAAENGFYDVPATGSASRNSDFDTWDDHPGSVAIVLNGTALAGSIWRCTVAPGGTLDTTNITFDRSLAGAAPSTTNLAYGRQALASLTSGLRNVAWGHSALTALTTGSDNNGFGYEAGKSITTGGYSVLFGSYAGMNIVGGDNHIAIGYRAGVGQVSNSNSIAIGYEALRDSPNGGAIGIGLWALQKLTTSGTNVIAMAVGIEAAQNTTTGQNVTALGMGCLHQNQTGSNHVVVGHDAGKNIVGNDGLTAVGKDAAYGVTGSFVTALGYGAIGTSTVRAQTRHTFVGAFAGQSATGDSSVGLGFEAGMDSGTGCVHIGHQAGKGNSSNNIFTLSNSTSTYLYGSFASGQLMLGKSTGGVANAGVELYTDGGSIITRSNQTPLTINRLASDGTLIDLRQDTTSEGSISVSGTTVSFNGAHLSRWSQWDGKAPKKLYRGTILSNVNAMCEWLGLEFEDAEGSVQRVDGVPKGVKIGDTVKHTYERTVKETVERPAEYVEVDEFVFEEVPDCVVEKLVIENGKARRVKECTTQLRQVYDEYPVDEEDGTPCCDPETGEQIIHRVPRKEKVRKLHREAETYEREKTVEETVDATVVRLRNENLPKCTVSAVEADRCVAGVYQDEDRNDDLGDFYVATVGDFVIRIGKGVKVENGDLIVSAGDGTGKPQGDDIRRASTVAKVTSIDVVETYPDGSYAVPCYLMAS